MKANPKDNYSLLIVEDDHRIAKLLSQFLRLEGFSVHCLDTGEAAIDYVKHHTPDLIILDLMLPKLDGLEVCEIIQPFYDNSILMLTASEGDLQEVTALNAGIDDFLNKPIRTHVLLARINALLRRQTPKDVDKLVIMDLEIDRKKRQVSRHNVLLELSDADFELLWVMANQAGKVIKREDLFYQLRGKEYDGLDRSIDMRISQLRKKLSAPTVSTEYIRTLRQLGYLFMKD